MHINRHQFATCLQNEIILMSIKHGDSLTLTVVVSKVRRLFEAKTRHEGVNDVFIRSAAFDPPLADDKGDTFIGFGDAKKRHMISEEVIVG